MINAKEYVPAAIASLALQGQVNMTGAFTAEQINSLFGQFFTQNLPIDLIESSMGYAVSIGLATRFDDPFTPPHFMLDNDELRRAIESSNNSDSAFTKARVLGQGWVSLALKGLNNQQDLEIPAIETSVPASDRIVLLSDNQRAEIDSNLTKIAEEITKSNSIRSAIGDDSDRFVAELEAGRKLLSVDRARISALVAVLLKPLRFLAEKFAEGSIGALAGALVVELLKLI